MDTKEFNLAKSEQPVTLSFFRNGHELVRLYDLLDGEQREYDMQVRKVGTRREVTMTFKGKDMKHFVVLADSTRDEKKA